MPMIGDTEVSTTYITKKELEDRIGVLNFISSNIVMDAIGAIAGVAVTFFTKNVKVGVVAATAVGALKDILAADKPRLEILLKSFNDANVQKIRVTTTYVYMYTGGGTAWMTQKSVTKAMFTDDEYLVDHYSENGICTVTASALKYRHFPYVGTGNDNPALGQYPKGTEKIYNKVVVTNKYCWIGWDSAGSKIYMPVKDYSSGERWGNCV